ncbi:MAG TPA: FAD-dependent thymidylate synthase [Solirubrobacteraceae bacterium]|nr:FAD-dependent thymidylate synthase [Solirubrobacteraceae bacterium]
MIAAETFSDAERALLAPFVSDLDAPVFALLGLPEATRGALFARYSRYPGTLRRLLLDEFGEELQRPPSQSTAAGARSEALYERVLGEYGDDSVAQLGGAHIACEWVSNVLTKVLQRPRLGAYLEQSTRYIPYDRPMPGGGYRYHREAELGPAYERAMDALFETYSELLAAMRPWLAERFPPAPGETPAAHERAVRAKALDLVRGLLPASALSHVGIYASGQTFERLILHLRAHPLPEAQRCGEQLLAAMRVAAPSFVTRVDRPDRGGEWARFLHARARAGTLAATRLGLGEPPAAQPAGVELVRAEGDEELLLAALLFEHSTRSEGEAREAVAALSAQERGELLAGLLGDRVNRRHLPGRGLESLRYRFEIVSDYGAFRDLQRHRMLTAQWQPLTPHLGAEVPEEVEQAGHGERYRAALERSRSAWRELADAGLEDRAPYALCLAYRVRYVLDLDAREAMHLIELRSGGEGHAAYRRIAHEMHARIAAVHPAVAAAMTFLDGGGEPRLERLAAESRREARGAD